MRSALPSLILFAAATATRAGALAAPTSAVADAPVWTAPAVDAERVRLDDEARMRAGGFERVGLPQRVDLAPRTSGRWTKLAGGDRAWRLAIRSPGALWTVLGFDRFNLPSGAVLQVRLPNGHEVLPPFTAADVRDDRLLWLPPIAGDTLVLELLWPAALARSEPDLRVGTVLHGYRPWGGLGGVEAAPAGGGDPCGPNINCPAGAAWQEQKRGVVKLLIAANGGTCTGTLVNNTKLSCIPYVLTANHCFQGETTSAASAASTTFQFHYEHPSCDPGPVNAVDLDHARTGATFVANADTAGAAASDYRLLQILGTCTGGSNNGGTCSQSTQCPGGSCDLKLPASLNAYFNGWNAAPAPASGTWMIHHPMGGVKLISHDADAPVDGTVEGADHWRVVWDEGGAVGGSSGAALFDQDGLVVGQLHVGAATCPGGFAEFGKFDVSWDDSTNQFKRLRTFLDPSPATGATSLLGMDQSFCGAPDPRLDFAAAVADDSQGNVDGIPDPGDILRLSVELHNAGPLAASGVSATVSSPDPLVTVIDGDADWPDLGPAATATSAFPHFTLDLNPNRVCGETVPLHFDIASGQGSWEVDVALATGTAVDAIVEFEDDMESGPNGWTTQQLAGSASWALGTSDSSSPPTSWHIAAPTTAASAALIMPPIASVPPGATLRFAHRMDTTSDPQDAGVLEYSTDGLVWHDAGELITAEPYNSYISSSVGSALGGRLAWSGDPGGWRTVEVDLGSLSAQPLQLRWLFASDASTGAPGWWIDDVVLEAAVHACTPPHNRVYPGARCRGQRPLYPGLPPAFCEQDRPGRELRHTRPR
jgi:hypothetical protein